MKKLITKNRLLIIILMINIFVIVFVPGVGQKCFLICKNNLINFIFSLAPLFIIVGLLDVWINKEIMTRITGKESGLKGSLLSLLLGIVTAVPLYALLPIAGMLLKKGSKISNVLLFICSCTSMRIPLLLFEVSSMGWKFTGVRLAVNLAGILFIVLIINKLLTKENKQDIYENVNDL